MMKIAFCGLGSISKRHIRNVCEILLNRNVDFEIDLYRHDLICVDDEDISRLVNAVYLNEELENSGVLYDVCFVTNPTAKHYDTIRCWLDHTKHMFIEKPVFDKALNNIHDMGFKTCSVYYVACPLRYMSVIRYLKENIDFKKVHAIRAISSSYLPEWRPNTDYRKSYSASRELGGGVAIDLIHEWDYIVHLIGTPKKVHYVSTKVSTLEIDSDDIACYIGEYDDKIVEVHLDYLGRKSIRECTLFMEDDTVVADLINGRVSFLYKGLTIELSEDRDCFQKREIEHFFSIIEGQIENDSTVEQANEVLKIATGMYR